MRDHLSRKTLTPSNRQVQQGMMASIGRLVVVSAFMLVFGVTSATAQTGQDERCADYTRQAHGLCTAAVAVGCFEDATTPACEDLTTNWEERCRVCEGQAPWEDPPVSCPCAVDGSASELFAEFQTVAGTDYEVLPCFDTPLITSQVVRVDHTTTGLFVAAGAFVLELECFYRLDLLGEPDVFIAISPITEDQLAACREDIRSLQAQLDCP